MTDDVLVLQRVFTSLPGLCHTKEPLNEFAVDNN